MLPVLGDTHPSVRLFATGKASFSEYLCLPGCKWPDRYPESIWRYKKVSRGGIERLDVGGRAGTDEKNEEDSMSGEARGAESGTTVRALNR